MDDVQTIGLTDLLAEVDRDLDEFRKKHPGDYGIKNISMWWDLERERLVVRHGSAAVVKRVRQAKTLKRAMALFFTGWVVAGATSAAFRLLIP